MISRSNALLVLLVCFLAVRGFAQGTTNSSLSMDARMRAKEGDWGSLKVINTAPTPNDARNFGAALPVGNGRLGAKVFGWPGQETIPLNDTTLWSGPGPEHFEDASHRTAMEATRSALAAHDYVKADALVRGMEGPNTQFYEPLAELQLRFPGHETFSGYSNTLDWIRLW